MGPGRAGLYGASLAAQTIIMEKNRMNLFREVQLFLDEKHAPAR
jgi:hypothetical protein